MPAECSSVSNCIVNCVCARVCAFMCVWVFLQSWGRSAVQWGVPSCWCPRSSSSSGSCVRRIWYVSPHPLHAPPAPALLPPTLTSSCTNHPDRTGQRSFTMHLVRRVVLHLLSLTYKKKRAWGRGIFIFLSLKEHKAFCADFYFIWHLHITCVA